MILFIDETEDDDYFVVTGLLVPSRESVTVAYKQFKKKVNMMKLKPKIKEKLCNEFKSTILDKEFQKIKVKMLEEIMKIDNKIIYSCYIKKEGHFNQIKKEEQYIELLNNIVSSINEEIEIIFDAFNKKDFEQNIINQISLNTNIFKIEPRNSFDEPGIQFVDNLCSVIRLSCLEQKNNFYSIIKENVIRV